ncbi:helix-turn-helix domain-containing protein [Nocardia otitidiscaviarum]|uniref:Helix-turn-helix domain-containing protein n=1 Tax=Nocardia otitidiscaviarum TaxID=1823 RepID=A0A516NRS3_9NOCA|nr:helix-turn-helix transcriptional regulator [Nocardia otitidiscaviarum]MBF6179810.1 helix-turn-helix domain-containing protein [Nocardia otitidiscaviarum]MCP9620817.1 helix-turn-helix domain-containing protein [Nocardia otitidiscaviarum]QDP81608.1 helix-turn-helix domain-containing protein [Nocardia otitidiscaviarum]
MTQANGEAGSTLPRRQLGRYLLEWRSRAGYTQAKAAQLLEIGATSLGRLEKGENSRIKSRDIQAACDLYGVPEDLTAALVGLARQANVKNWWHQYGDLIPKDFDVYVGLEAAAARIITYQPELVPGLLQIADYDRALATSRPDDTDDERERRVQLKMQRQRIVTRKTQPVRLDVVVGEAALHRIAGSRGVMAAQLRHLADRSTDENVELRVLPFAAGFPSGISMPPFVVLQYGESAPGEPVEPPVVFLEGVVGNLYIEDADDVVSFARSYDRIRNAALDCTTSRQLLRQLAREYGSGH